jgi:NodT family efflux transporter outer membrane factor (OMF) lipoprotein
MGVSLEVSWELDIWNKLGYSEEAKLEELAASKLDYKFARESLVAEAARAYFLAIEAKLQEDYAKLVLDNYHETLEVSEALYESGVVSIEDVHIVKAELASYKNQYEKTKDSKQQIYRSLEVLMGKYSDAKFKMAEELPELPEGILAGVPSDILEHRPDIIAAWHRLNAAYDIKQQAEAARLPRLSLTSSIGTSSDALKDLIHPENVIWRLVGNLSAPLFKGGDLEADVEIAAAEQDVIMAKYKQSVLQAFVEVENALSREQFLKQRMIALTEACHHSDEAVKIVETKYQQGEVTLLEVQQVKRNAISPRIELIRVKMEMLLERVNLYLALGLDALGNDNAN